LKGRKKSIGNKKKGKRPVGRKSRHPDTTRKSLLRENTSREVLECSLKPRHERKEEEEAVKGKEENFELKDQGEVKGALRG